MRTSQSSFKEIFGLALWALLLAWIIGGSYYELHRGWESHAVVMPWTKFSLDATLAKDPIAFWISVACYVLLLAFFSFVSLMIVYFSLFPDRAQKDARPPLDRNPFDGL